MSRPGVGGVWGRGAVLTWQGSARRFPTVPGADRGVRSYGFDMMTITTLLCVAVLTQPGDAANDWASAEGPILTNHRQLTFDREFFKAGEAYFNTDASWVIFQAVPTPAEGEIPGEHYGMYVAAVERDDRGSITGLGASILVSPPNSANTCGWFDPNDPQRIIFGSTLVPPSADNVPGYQRGTGRYRWAFPTEMEIVERLVPEIPSAWPRRPAPDANTPKPLFTKPGYDAEGSFSPDGRHILYANVDMLKSAGLGRADADLWVFDTRNNEHTPLIEADGYDGGPFFGPPDESGLARWICYRSDRKGDNLLQLFIAELAYGDADDPTRITGIEREVQLTANEHVNWCPFWDPTGRILVYATSEVGHFNYEVFALEVLDENGEPVTDAKPVRLTHAMGFDGLPVFNHDGSIMMWTSQRGEKAPGADRALSQLWIADVDLDALLSTTISAE